MSTHDSSDTRPIKASVAGQNSVQHAPVPASSTVTSSQQQGSAGCRRRRRTTSRRTPVAAGRKRLPHCMVAPPGTRLMLHPVVRAAPLARGHSWFALPRPVALRRTTAARAGQECRVMAPRSQPRGYGYLATGSSAHNRNVCASCPRRPTACQALRITARKGVSSNPHPALRRE